MEGVSLEDICKENGIAIGILDKKIDLLDYCEKWESLAIRFGFTDAKISDIKSISDPEKQREEFLRQWIRMGEAKCITFF